jgi:hypothetical protein
MFKAFKEFRKTTAELSRFQKSSMSQRRLVVFSEGSHDWPHLGPIVETYLALSNSETLSYVSSQESDPGLHFKNARFFPYYIGSGTSRTIFFKSLEAQVLFLTLTDLDVFELKKSLHPVRYVYTCHSISSSHTVYREKAFEAYDTIFCVGPHHDLEFRKEEALKNLAPRKLYPVGSVKLDQIVKEGQLLSQSAPTRAGSVLLAPSWGSCSFAEDRKILTPLVEGLLKKTSKLYLRLHPMTVRRIPDFISSVKTEFAAAVRDGKLLVEDNLNDNSSLIHSEYMISDWSGAATEYAFAFKKPVLFINTPQKLNNPRWQEFELPAIEDLLRKELGLILEIGDLSQIEMIHDKILESRPQLKEKIEEAYQKWIYNPQSAAEVAARHLREILQPSKKDSGPEITSSPKR